MSKKVQDFINKMTNVPRLLLLLCTVLFAVCCFAQRVDVQEKLRSKYDNVTYSPEGGGWYLVTYQVGSKTLMGFCDKKGAMICPNVEKIEKYNSWINLYVLDAEKKAIHDNWEADMRIYNKDLEYYNRVEAQYKAELKNYNNKVSAAKAEAKRRWQNARNIAERNARANQSKSSGSGLFGAILQGVGNALAVQNAIDAVKYQPFEDQVISERGLGYAPVKPENPKPTKPVEPASGYEWKAFTYIQPCPFDQIDYESIKSNGGHAIARKGTKYGVVDSNLKTTVAFNYDELKEKNSIYECRNDRLWGVVTSDGKEKFPCMFTSLCLIKMNGKNILLTNINDKCGAVDFETASALVPNIYSFIRSVYITDEEQCFLVKKDNLYGVCSADGKVILETKYPKELEFIHIKGSKNFYIKAITDKNAGLFDINGKEIVPFDKCNKFEFIENSFIKMCTPSGTQGVVGLDGTPVADIAYNNIIWNETLNGFVVTQYDKMGVMSASGELLFPMKQCESLICEEDFIKYKNGVKSKSYGALDYNGNVILEPKYASDKIKDKVRKLKKKNSNISTSYATTRRALTNSFAKASQKFIKR